MSTLLKSPLSNSVAEGIYNEILRRTARYYYFLGKTLQWEGTGSDFVPSPPEDTYQYELQTRNEIILVKQIQATDVAFVISRYQWVNGFVYDMYDDTYSSTNPAHSGAERLEDAIFYTVTNEFNVYKCISNNYDSPSTVQPTGTSSNQITTPDGYIWKFMYTIPIALRNRFLTAQFIPITTSLRNQFYSSGEIAAVSIDNPGFGYTNPPTLTVQGDGFLAENPFVLFDIFMSDRGAGYTTVPAVSFSAPTVVTGDEETATGVATIDAGEVDDINITLTGYGYAAPPSITIDPPVVANGVWTASTALILNRVVSFSDNNGTRFYRATTAGTTGLTPPTHITGTVANGSAQLLFVGKQAVAIAVMQKTNAILTAILDNGQVSDVIIQNGGIGYTFASVIVTGDNAEFGSNAVAVVSPELSVGDLNTLQSNVELLATNGSIDFIKVTAGGVGYAVANVTIDGDGVGATATAVITGGIITGINMVNRGSGYTKATVTITGTGTGATARAIMSPVGGHGKNAVNEFFARSLMFSSTISNERIHNYAVENDYRQVGFLKNPFTYNNLTYYRGQVGTACFKVVGAINVGNFELDEEIWPSGRSNKKYRIIALDTEGAILQSMDNDVPQISDVFRNAQGDTFIVDGVTLPELNKFSGELLYIDNRGSFTPTDEQTISIKTVIRF
jgi:hypothetical protein